MPVLLRYGGYIFRCYASDQDEPAHVHVIKESKTAKYWLAPIVSLQSHRGYRPHELNQIEKIIDENYDLLLERWNDFFNN